MQKRESAPLYRFLLPLTSLLLLSAAEVTAGECKGLSESACSADAACTWVKQYSRSDGLKVSGYCRTRYSGTSGKKQTKSGAEGGGK